MDNNSQVPGFAEITDWPSKPVFPVQLRGHGFYRDPRPYCTHYFELVDAQGLVYPFFFERFLGRLCYGATNENGDDAAFVRSGSVLANDVFRILYAALDEDDIADVDHLREVVDRGLRWAQR